MKISELFETSMTPEQAWENLLNAICNEDPDEVDKDDPHYKKAINDPVPIALVKELMNEGVTFDESTADHWAEEITGGFGITHPKYARPEGIDSKAALRLANYIYELMGIEKEFWHDIKD